MHTQSPTHPIHNPRWLQFGSTTLLAMITLATLALAGATVLSAVSRRYHGNEQVQGWQEALFAAEGGADIGLANLRWKVVSGSPTAFDSSLGWVSTTSGSNTTYTYRTPTVVQTGEGATQTWAVVTIDAPTATTPAGLKDTKGSQWYRIRSTGHARLPGLKRASIDALQDANARRGNSLRKLNLLYDRSTGGQLAIPEATRTIEQIIQPKTSGGWALLARTTLTISGPQIIDSYDSTDSTKSTNGLYDAAKRQKNGSVYSNGSASTALTIGLGEKVYGNAATNGSNFTDPHKTIQSPGTINNSTNTPLPVIPDPDWGMPGQPTINGTVTTVTSTNTISVDSDSTQNYYKLSAISAPLTIALKPGVTTGTINIWLTGSASTSGSITIAKGATVNIYFTGDTFHPSNTNSINNLNLDPSTFTIYGTGTYAGSGPGIDIHVGGSGGVQNFYGTVYAPYRKINLKYDGNTNYDPASAFNGSFVGDTIILKGSVHYDEAAGGGSGPVVDYSRVSYVEDPR